MDLGLELLGIAAKGDPLTHYDIAAWCDCSVQAIIRLERRTLKKLRTRVQFGTLRELGREMAA